MNPLNNWKIDSLLSSLVFITLYMAHLRFKRLSILGHCNQCFFLFYTLFQYPGGDGLTGQGKCEVLKTLWGETWESLSTREVSRKLIKDEMKTQRDELTRTRLTQKHRSNWVIFVSKNFAYISLAIKDFLSIESGTQYTNYQTNNSMKNQIYPKIRQNTSLRTDFTIQQYQCHQDSRC